METSNSSLSLSRHRRVLVWLWLVAAALILLAWLQVGAMIRANQIREIENAERDLANLTRVSQEHASRTLRSADQVLRFVQAGYLERGLKLDLAGMTANGVIDTEIFNQVGVIDSEGIYRISNLPIHRLIDLSDRDHFKVHLHSSSGEMYISKPVLGRASGKWSIQLTRRITRDDGTFAGVAVVSIDPGYFSRFYGELNLGRRGVQTLLGLDGVVRARVVGNKDQSSDAATDGDKTGAVIPRGNPIFNQISLGRLSGSYVQNSVIDGVERNFYFRKIPQYPLIVVAGVESSELLASHLNTRNALLSQATISSFLIVALAAALTRHLQQMRRQLFVRQRAEELLQERTEQLNTILSLSPDGFVSFDEFRRVKYVSPAFVQMTGLTENDLRDLEESKFFNLLLAQAQERNNSNNGKKSSEALLVKVANSHNTPVQFEIENSIKRTLQVGRRQSNSKPVSHILYFRDVTWETEVDQMKSEFLSTAAHELRTPMASILGFSEVLVNGDVGGADIQEFLSIIHTQSRRMADILDELLDLARIEARRGKDFRYSPVCLQELVADIVRTFGNPSGRTPLISDSAQAPVMVMADVKKLRQAVLNVLSNAFKYSHGGDVSIWVDMEDKADEEVRGRISISDCGIGMTSDQVKRVCDRFYRADSSGAVAGTGLGMSIVKEIIDLHRGRVEIVSELGRGTTVHLTMPVIAKIAHT